jgi:hypothetical protein
MDDLKNKLDAWKVDVDLPPRFQAEVWQRIAERAPRQAGLLDTLLHLRSLLLRPAWSVALVIAGITLGLGTARVAASHTRSDARQELETQYVRMIDPLAPRS